MFINSLLLTAICMCPFHQEPTAKSLIEKMLANYYSAQTLAGTIKLTVSTQAGSASLDSTIQYQRPAKLYIFQQKAVPSPDPEQPSKWLVTSDGDMFSYQIPNERYHAAPGLRLVEPVLNQRVGTKHDIGSIYAASSKSIGDRSMPLDISIAAKTDLVYRRAQWATYDMTGKREINGKTGYVVAGDFRPYAGSQATGKFEMTITEAGDLLQYTESANVVVGEGPSAQTVQIISRWDVDLKVGASVNQALFKVVVK